MAEQRGCQPRAGASCPIALRDPFRDSHFTDPGYLALWPDAKDYLATLEEGSKTGLLDLSLLQTDKYEEVLRQAISKLWAGDDPKAILDQAASEWDAITEKIGVDKQKAVYADWAIKSGAYPKYVGFGLSSRASRLRPRGQRLPAAVDSEE